ncbi:membrane protease YdiL (CAAX protease family) [Allocatelliglobosispora scoriae]|uniref:Membrane protease YdiL (CAAX protease family) n=1 Tax=Allocatelliglobosispora scoriae TaxID=643052 RepID=A0A841BKG8_9ACTN|nr:hypothetical protein [Allocatelliglobosispora scoriae]MBB5867679.1 membrane protease YdiL (CAAX protease family) [Allocatelliglobosispora scoriae]
MTRVATRVFLALVAMVAGYIFAALLVVDDGGENWRYYVRQALSTEGFLIVAFYFMTLAIGLVLHGLPEIGRRDRFAPAIVATGLLAVYGLVIALLAWPLAGTTSGSPIYDQSPPNPGPLFVIWLCCALLPIAFAACAGQLFPHSRDGMTSGERPLLAVFTDGRMLRIAVISWVLGGIALLVLLFAIAVY